MNVTTGEPVRARYPLLSSTGFLWFWSADSLSMVGTYITALAVQTLRASPIELGVLGAARWLPYLHSCGLPAPIPHADCLTAQLASPPIAAALIAAKAKAPPDQS
ncbi:hypothetical protein ACQP1G_14295 [Nocardia sp. CA-107356]|uniref:hypothetical protein n=1 Tax=Nocardia sp. CA-107356 TaxID=3239972 RepID=UPI003D8C71E2